MNKLYHKQVLIRVILSLFLMVSSVVVYAYHPKPNPRTDSTRVQAKGGSKITDTRKEKPTFLKNGIRVNVVPFKPAPIKENTPATQNKTNGLSDDKVLSNVKVYPNPVSDQINVTYHLNKEVMMTIKVMDFLGNEVATLLSRKTSTGDQNNSFNISSKLNSGLYFIRFIAGNETVVKRISVQ